MLANVLYPHVIFQTKKILPSIRKVSHPPIIKVWSHANTCAAVTDSEAATVDFDSATGLHLLQNPDCAAHCNVNQFSVLAKARTRFLLVAMEAAFNKMIKPVLCRLKKLVYSLRNLH